MADVVTIQIDTCCMELYPVFFAVSSLSKIRKLLKWAKRDMQNNAKAIPLIEQILNGNLSTARAEWEQASIDYQNGFKAPYGDKYINKQNQRLLSHLKKAKATYERELKKTEMFRKLKTERKIK